MKTISFQLLIGLLLCFSTSIWAQFNALQFSNNTDYVSTSWNPTFGSSQDFSIEFRIKTSGWSGDPSILSDKNWSSGNNDGFNIALAANGTGIDVNVGDGFLRADLDAGTINDGQWHAILITFDRDDQLSMYIDGALAQSTGMSSVGDINTSYNFHIGQDGTGTYGTAAVCELSEVRIWNKVLPLGESDLCHSVTTSHPSYADLIQYWKLNEGTGTLANNAIGSYFGTVSNGAWTSNNNITIGCAAPLQQVGAGTALDFDGNNDWVDCSNGKNSATALGLPTQDITIEAWVNARDFEKWNSIVSFLQDNGSTEGGWDLELRDNNKFGFTLAADGTLTYLESANSFNTNEWYHIAGVYDGTTMKLYVNGVEENSSTNESGTISYLDSWLAIGMYKDDNESNATDALIDEVRIWNVARSQNDIRTTMCHKLAGSEAGLVAYWRMDDSLGTILHDWSNSNLNGSLQNMDVNNDWVLSGAALGDTSVFAYHSTWGGQNLSLSSTSKGNLTLSDVIGDPQGVHIYQVHALPNTINNIQDIGNTNLYYGTFVAGGTTPNYKATYDYNNYSDAVANENFLTLYNRNDNSVGTWTNSGASLDATNDNIYATAVAGRREFLLADFVQAACAAPSNLATDSISFNEAWLSWTSTGTSFNLEYGNAGFTLGTGTLISGIVTNSHHLTNLGAVSSYDFYVQVNCPNGTSGWAGPFNFSTFDPCGLPASVQVTNITMTSAEIAWVSHNNKWIIEWAPSSLYSPGLGINTTATSNPFMLTGLSSNTSYSFRIMTDCDSLQSSWTNVYTFTTDSVMTLVQTIEQGSTMRIFPNPSSGQLTIQTNISDANAWIEIYNTVGQMVRQTTAPTLQTTMHLNDLPNGIYIIRYHRAGDTTSQKFKLSK